MHITGTHINYYFVCRRKLWFFAHNIQMEHTSELVDEGRFIHQTTYPQRARTYREIEIDGIKIDYYDSERKIIHEIKKSDKVEDAHRWQLKYYLLILKRYGITDAHGILEYPSLRKREKISLNPEDEKYLEKIENEIRTTINSPEVPPRITKKLCQKCSYYDFCWVTENEPKE